MRRLFTVLAVASLAPALSMSALAQVRSPDYLLNAAETALLKDVKVQCKSIFDPLVARARAEGENMAEFENGLGLIVAPTIQGEMSTESNLREILANLEAQGGGDPEAPLYRCIVNARLAQIKNGNRPVGQAAAAPTPPRPAAPTVSASSASAQICTEKANDLATRARASLEPGAERVRKLGESLKALFTGECAGVPDAATMIARADGMIARAGGSAGGSSQASADGSGGGSATVYDQNGRPVRSSGGAPAGGGGSGGRAMTGASAGAPVPDANRCVRLVENTRGQACGPNSQRVHFRNDCPQKVHMQACIFDTGRSRWECGSRSGERGTDLQTSRCQARGDFLYAGCTDAAMAGGSRGNCGGDPNRQGY